MMNYFLVDPHSPSADAAELKGKKYCFMQSVRALANSIVVLNEVEKEQENFHEMLMSLGESVLITDLMADVITLCERVRHKMHK